MEPRRVTHGMTAPMRASAGSMDDTDPLSRALGKGHPVVRRRRLLAPLTEQQPVGSTTQKADVTRDSRCLSCSSRPVNRNETEKMAG